MDAVVFVLSVVVSLTCAEIQMQNTVFNSVHIFKFCTLFSFIYCTHISITVYLYMCGGPDATYKYISFISFPVFTLAL